MKGILFLVFLVFSKTTIQSFTKMKKILIGHLSIFKPAKSILSSDGKLISNGNVLNQIDVSTFEIGLYYLILELQNGQTINTKFNKF
jgi:hypothetical protein